MCKEKTVNIRSAFDVVIDLETLALSANAAILQVAAVAWDRDADCSPLQCAVPPFNSCVDVRSCIIDGFDVDPATVDWWRAQPDAVKARVFAPQASPLGEVVEALAAWFGDVREASGAERVFLWAQGSDFDIPLLRSVFARYSVPFPVDFHLVRDARTYISEVGGAIFHTCDEDVIWCNAMAAVPAIPEPRHDAMGDAARTACCLWSLFRSFSKSLLI